MSRYVPRHARKRRGLLRAAVLPAVLGAAVVVAVIVGVSLRLPDSRAAEADGSGPVSGGPSVMISITTSTLSASTSASPTPTAVPSTTSPTTAGSSTTMTIYIHPIAEPARIVIPSIEVDAKLIPVGLLDNGDMEVPPFGLAGWYEPGPLPGDHGPTVVVAHVDTKKGPDVFYRLKDLEPGDEILVYGPDGDVATFGVDSKEQRLKTELPVERIWNDTWEPVIRLITCTGEFDRSSGHYLSNMIVYGHLVE
ncbi:MAG: class F sortase [Actinomycetia bacterium]|nr:class F sortase [Actinomycetes bacterium]